MQSIGHYVAMLRLIGKPEDMDIWRLKLSGNTIVNNIFADLRRSLLLDLKNCGAFRN
jgi:hypothetical protein